MFKLYRKHSWKIVIILLLLLLVSMPIWFSGDVFTFFAKIYATRMLQHKTTMSDITVVGDNLYSIHQFQINNRGTLEKYPMIKLNHLYCELNPENSDVLDLGLAECNYGDIYLLTDENNHTNIVDLPINMPPRLLLNNIRLHVNTNERLSENELVVILDGYLLLAEDGSISDICFKVTTFEGQLLVRVEKNHNYEANSKLPNEMLPYNLKNFDLINIMKYEEAGKIIKYWPAIQSLLEFVQ